MIYKNCEACFKKFPINHAQKYCSKTCAKEGRLKKRKLWFKNSEKGKAQIQKQLTVWNINYRKTKSGKEANKRYVRKKISNDPAYKMGQNLRKRLWIFIKRGNKKKIYDDWSKEKITNRNNKTNQDIKFKLRAMYNRDKNTIKKDGVNNCQYKIVNTSLYKNKMKRIKVDV